MGGCLISKNKRKVVGLRGKIILAKNRSRVRSKAIEERGGGRLLTRKNKADEPLKYSEEI